MTALVPRLVTTTLASAALSLFLTVLSITAIESHKLRWDGSFCTPAGCAVTAVAAPLPPRRRSLFGGCFGRDAVLDGAGDRRRLSTDPDDALALTVVEAAPPVHCATFS